MYPYDENNNSTNAPETGSERPAEDGSYRIVKPDAERESCYRDASYTPQGEASFDGYYVPGGRGPKPPEPEKKPHKRGIGAAGVIALCLVCALLGGVSGGLIANANRPDEAVVSDEPSTEPLTQTSPAASGSTAAASTSEMSARDIYYNLACKQVVGIQSDITATNIFGMTASASVSGSGFVISEDGYILTNYHVIEGASTVKVTAYDGTTYDAAVIGGDKDYDIAVIKVEGTNFQPVVIGKSGSVQIGETVAAVGNPLGELTFSMSQGIVSCVNRAINVDGKPFNMIQVDCSINPGNSGGPLFTSYGEVIGIVSAKYSSYSNTTVEGIGFAIPIDDVLAMVKDIMTDGYVTNKPYIGITPQNMTAQMAQQYRYDVTQGVFVCSVEPGSAAEKAGLQMGDVITKIGDTAISDMNDLNAAKKSYRAGDTVTLTIYRAGGTKEVELTFDAVPQTQETAQDSSQQQQQGGSNGGYYYNPWDFFNSFFGNGYYGSSYSGESRDAA